MAPGLILTVTVSAQTRTCPRLLSNSFAALSFSPARCRIPIIYRPSTRFFCKCSDAQAKAIDLDMDKYKAAFSRRMAMAGLKPHHRIALGVSGGPDSMALCVLTAGWKTQGLNGAARSAEFIDGLLAIIVDHGLREQSKEEANIVSCRVSEMGIRCEVVRCNWLNGRPKQGHLQEAARDMRYQLFQNVCFQHQTDVLFIAHHADDQAELFILRLSRNSGVLGLAGMAFTSQIFTPPHPDLKNHAILLVRPLLQFTKEDMYMICQGAKKDWVEDPSNRSTLFARNRIRMSLGNLSSCIFNSELEAVISACRKTRLYVEDICSNLINETVTIMDKGFVVIDLELLNPSKIVDICLSKFLALILQFTSQRQRPVRGSTSKLLLNYFRTFPCKTSLTAAGCYLCPAPKSRGTKVLVCCSVDCPLPSKMELFHTNSIEEQRHCDSDLEQILADAKSYSDHLLPYASKPLLLGVTSDSVLTEAKRLNILSQSTYRNILLLQKDEIKHFKLHTEVASDTQLTHEGEYANTSTSKTLRPGQIGYFMNRFFVTWKLSREIASTFPKEVPCDWVLVRENRNGHCSSCMVGDDMVAEVRHMIESDWLYLAKLSLCPSSENFQQDGVVSDSKTEQIKEKTNLCLDFVRSSAQRALLSLKSIPVAARRSLPVLVNSQGQLLSIPCINYNHCPCLMASAVFKPKVPLGGGHSSYI